MTKLIFSVLLLIAFAGVNAQQFVKLTGEKQVLKVENLVANADDSISYTLDGNRWTAPKYSYDYARVPKPAEISAADKVLKKGNFVKAEKMYQIEFGKYKNLGWGIYCITGRAKALDKLGRVKEALIQIERIMGGVSPDPNLKKDLTAARLLYVDLLIKSKKYKAAAIQAEALLASDDNNVVFTAFERKGDIALLQNDKKKAVREYLQACYLVTDHKRVPALLYRTAILLRGLDDKRWIQFSDMLKKRYPNSEYAKKL